MKPIFLILALLLSLSSFAKTNRAICINDEIVIGSPDPYLTGIDPENIFLFERFNKDVILVTYGKYFFPDFPNQVKGILSYQGKFKGLPHYKDKNTGTSFYFSCDKNQVIVDTCSADLPVGCIEILDLK